ncbi:sensor histidine kinase, partial [Kibdelosporangium lantanae]
MKAWRRTSLGTRLALAIGVLALVVFAVVGTVLVTSSKRYLERQFDTQIAKNQDSWKAKGYAQQPPGWYSVAFTVKGGQATQIHGGTPPDDVG